MNAYIARTYFAKVPDAYLGSGLKEQIETTYRGFTLKKDKVFPSWSIAVPEGQQIADRSIAGTYTKISVAQAQIDKFLDHGGTLANAFTNPTQKRGRGRPRKENVK
jgi:hypothetical protein